VPLSEPELRRRISEQKWTAHNLELAPGVWTLPDRPDLLSSDLSLRSIFQLLSLLYRDPVARLRVADLGCLEGGFSIAFARLGAEVVGVEVRPQNIEKCLLVKEQLGAERLHFVQADVKSFSRDSFGAFDVTLALGILYHLDDPAGWLQQVAEATRGVLFVDSHYAPRDEHELAALNPKLGTLGPVERRCSSGWEYEGRWFPEFSTEVERESDGMLWASYSNPRSFWLTKQSLLSAIQRCGFASVLEVHDQGSSRYDFLSRTYSRCLIAAVKPAGLR